MVHRFLKLFVVRIFPNTTNRAMNVTFNGTLFRHILFHRNSTALEVSGLYHIIFLIGNLHKHLTRMNPKPYPPSHSYKGEEISLELDLIGRVFIITSIILTQRMSKVVLHKSIREGGASE